MCVRVSVCVSAQIELIEVNVLAQIEIHDLQSSCVFHEVKNKHQRERNV